MFHAHAGWFRDRPIFEALYIGMVKKSVEQTLSDFEYAELARLYMRYLIFLYGIHRAVLLQNYKQCTCLTLGW